MARKPRVQFPGAVYHVITRGDGRRALFHDDGHYKRFTDGLETEVLRSDWQVKKEKVPRTFDGQWSEKQRG